MVITSGRSDSASSTPSRPLEATPTTRICPDAVSISVSRLRKNPESSTTRTETVIRFSYRNSFAPAEPSAVMLQQAGDINNERDTAVAGDRCTSHARSTLKPPPKRLDNHFFLAH